MPPERWWDSGNSGRGGKSGGNSSRGRALPRQRSDGVNRSVISSGANPQEVACVADLVDTDVFDDE